MPAERSAVWQAFATTDGLSTWLGQRTRVDLRKGGEWTVYFPNGSTGGGTILSFTPETEIVIAALAPKQFPTVRAERTTARFQLESNGKSTIVNPVQTGWKTGEEWDRAYDYLAQGNAQLLESLRERFVMARWTGRRIDLYSRRESGRYRPAGGLYRFATLRRCRVEVLTEQTRNRGRKLTLRDGSIALLTGGWRIRPHHAEPKRFSPPEPSRHG